MSEYKTTSTWLGSEYGCRIYQNGSLIVEGRCQSRDMIGATFRDLFRTLDKIGYVDEFVHAARERKYKEGNTVTNAKHYWHI